MRIHTNASETIVRRAAIKAGVELRMTVHKSRTHDHGFEVSLRGASRRRPNFYNGDGSYAATWDQWGVFLAAIFDADVLTRCGSGKRPTYADAEDFHRKTFGRFITDARVYPDAGLVLTTPTDMHGDHTFKFAGVPYVQKCTKCSAQYTWQ